MSATGIADRLRGEGDELGDRLPDARTVRNWIKNGWIVVTERDAPWTLEEARGDDAALVVPALRLRTRRLTVDQAEWVVRVRRADPGLDVESAVSIALMASSSGANASENALAVLVHQPWADGGESLFRAIRDGQVSSEVLKAGGEHEYMDWHIRQDLAKRKEASGER